MFKRTPILVTFAFLTLAAGTFVACTDDSSSAVGGASSGNPLNPGTDSGTPPVTGDGGPGPGPGPGGCPNKPAGCFCGTPTTQKEFLNRCTNAAALPVTLTPKAATTADIP